MNAVNAVNTIEDDLRYLQQATNQLEAYLPIFRYCHIWRSKNQFSRTCGGHGRFRTFVRRHWWWYIIFRSNPWRGVAENRYLLSKAMQWPLEGQSYHRQPSFPPLTVENYLLTRQRLQQQAMSAQTNAAYQQVEREYQNVLNRWRSTWGQKASQGFHHRLHLWQQYLHELGNQLGEQADRYPREVRLRVMLALLSPYADATTTEDFSQLAFLDQKLRHIFQPGDFIWPRELEKPFPEPVFWYLYGSPVQANKSRP